MENEQNKNVKKKLLVQINDILKKRKNPLFEICKLLKENIPHYNWVGFYFVNPENGKELILGPYIGEATEHTNIPFGRGICGQVALSKKTFVAQDVSKETNYLACSLQVKSEIVIPIIKDDKFIAQLDIDSHYTNPFTKGDVNFLEKVCNLLQDYINK